MNLLLAILLIILAFFGGMLAGMYLVRKQIEKEFADNPRLNIDAVRTMLSANGQNQMKQRYNKCIVKLKINKKQHLKMLKRKNKLLKQYKI